MPLYEYRCAKCGELFEVIEKFVDAPLVTHENCGGAVQRQISAPALQFKGTGWYITDYAKGGNKDNPKADAPAANGKPATEASPAKSEKSEKPAKSDSSAAPASAPSSGSDKK